MNKAHHCAAFSIATFPAKSNDIVIIIKRTIHNFTFCIYICFFFCITKNLL